MTFYNIIEHNNLDDVKDELVFYLECTLKLGVYNDDCLGNTKRSSYQDATKSIAFSFAVGHGLTDLTKHHNNIVTKQNSSVLAISYSIFLLVNVLVNF